jgi:hypothetical protein
MRRLARFPAAPAGTPFDPGNRVLPRRTSSISTEAAFERFGRSFVQAIVDRAKITLACIVPAFCLLICAESLAASCDRCGSEPGTESTYSLQDGRHPPLHRPLSSDAAVRHGILRTGKLSKSQPLTFLPIRHSRTAVAAPLELSSPRHESPPTLVTRWQFICRAARDPRAPSFS